MTACTQSPAGTPGTSIHEQGVFSPRVLLRGEGFVAAALAVGLYGYRGGSWALFAVLVLTPDLSMIGYLTGPTRGAAIYNLVHTYVLPLALVAVGWLTGVPLAIDLALIWVAHLGVDRLLGFGLKYRNGFKTTHLDRV